jgi:hypothetical protein
LESKRSILAEGWNTRPEEAAQLESELQLHPHNVAVRTRLISYYTQAMIPQPRQRHILWLIEHHPEADVFQEATVTDLAPNWTGMNDASSYERSRGLWLDHTRRDNVSPKVLRNAAIALAGPNPQMSLQLMRRGRDAEPTNSMWLHWLAWTYSLAVRTTIAGGWMNLRAFAGPGRGRDLPAPLRLPLAESEQLKKELESSTNVSLLVATAEVLLDEMNILGNSSPAPDVRESRLFGEDLLRRAAQLKQRGAR